jgi:hypothetical protein
MAHQCHAYGCPVTVPPRMFMCRAHWRQLPKKFQDAIWREYSPGQERRKDPSARYMAVQQLAVGTLEFRPDDEAAAQVYGDHLLRSMMFARMAIDEGHGNPIEHLLPPGTEVPTMDELRALAVSSS